MAFDKSTRQKVFNKYNGHCAYCGCEISDGAQPKFFKKMQIDHIQPIYRGDLEWSLKKNNRVRGSNEIKNLNPACQPCNSGKGCGSLEEYRKTIRHQITRLNRESSSYRVALRYGLIKKTGNKVVFYFER